MSEVVEGNCPSCGTPFAGKYCHRCGEQQVFEHDWTWAHFVHHLLHEILHVDAKIFKTFWLLFRRPGFLTAEYWAGRRVLYLTPLRLYLIGAAIHYVAFHFGIFLADFTVKVGGREQRASEFAAAAASAAGIALERIPEVQHHYESIYKMSVYLGPLILALASWVWFRKRRPYFIQHLIFATHVYAFWFLLTPLNGLWDGLRRILPLVTLVYLYFATRLLYGGAFWPNLGRALLLRVAHLLAEMAAIGVAVAGAVFWAFATRGH